MSYGALRGRRIAKTKAKTRPSEKRYNMKNLLNFFFSFDKLMKEKLVIAFFWLAVIVFGLKYFSDFLSGINLGPLAWLVDRINFLGSFILGIVAIRLLCEVAVAIFRINNNLSPDGGKSETADIDPITEARKAAEAAALKAKQVSQSAVSKTSATTKSKMEDVSKATKSTYSKTVESAKTTAKKTAAKGKDITIGQRQASGKKTTRRKSATTSAKKTTAKKPAAKKTTPRKTTAKKTPTKKTTSKKTTAKKS